MRGLRETREGGTDPGISAGVEGELPGGQAFTMTDRGGGKGGEV